MSLGSKARARSCVFIYYDKSSLGPIFEKLDQAVFKAWARAQKLKLVYITFKLGKTVRRFEWGLPSSDLLIEICFRRTCYHFTLAQRRLNWKLWNARAHLGLTLKAWAHLGLEMFGLVPPLAWSFFKWRWSQVQMSASTKVKLALGWMKERHSLF